MKRFLFAVFSVVPFLFAGCGVHENNGTNPEPSSSVTLSVSCGPVGNLQKTKVISLQKLFITLTASGESDIIDTFSLSGYGRQTVTKDYLNIASAKTWTVTAISKDANGTTIHSGSKTFSVQPGENIPVNLDLNAKYSMLKVS